MTQHTAPSQKIDIDDGRKILDGGVVGEPDAMDTEPGDAPVLAKKPRQKKKAPPAS